MLLLAVLFLDELFLSYQTMETNNFFASRAYIVHENPSDIDEVFNQSVQNTMLFTKDNLFFNISPFETKKVGNNLVTSSKLGFIFDQPPFQGDCHPSGSQANDFYVCTSTKLIEKP